jgi:nucleotide-binding universal stress UspA family protein
VVVALDASEPADAALEAAAELALRLRAELQGLFVEDRRLLGLARAPLAWRVSLATGSALPIEAASLESEVAALAARADRALNRAATSRGLRASFRRVKGSVDSEVLAAAGPADLLVLGWSGRSGRLGRRLGGTARAALDRGVSPVLVLPAGSGLRRAPWVVLQEGPGLERLLAAADLVAGEAAPTVVLLARSMERALDLRRRASQALGASARRAAFRNVVGPGSLALSQALAGAESGLLLMLGASPLLSQATTRAVIEEVGAPLLLVR